MAFIANFYILDCSFLLVYLIKQALDVGLEDIMHFFMKALDAELQNVILMETTLIPSKDKIRRNG